VSSGGFGISSAEPSGSATTVLVSKMDLREIGCEDERWMELVLDLAQWGALILAVLNFQVLLPQRNHKTKAPKGRKQIPNPFTTNRLRNSAMDYGLS